MLSLAVVYIGFAVLAPICALVQGRDAPPVFARRRWIDWVYWLLTPLFTGVMTRAATLTFAAVVAIVLFGSLQPQHLLSTFHDRSPIGSQPLWLQAIEVFVIADFLSYWSHRLRHRFVWPLHAVHHSPRELDWLAAARMHPFDDVIDNVTTGLPILLAGFDPILFLLLDPILFLHTLYLHLAVSWDLGPLRYVIASPAFHRWHHAADRVALNRNFGGVLSIWDLIFGTFYLPKEQPKELGIPDDPLPESIIDHLWRPIWRLVSPRR